MFSHEYNKEKNDIAFFSTNSPCFTFDEDDGILLYSLLREVVNANNYDMSYAMLLLNCALRKLYHNNSSVSSAPTSYSQQAMLYMLENFQNGITLNDVANHLGLSGAYFSDLFAKQTGTKFKEYLDDIRFSYAKKLLTLTELSIKEIQFKSGFRDYTNFVRRFKEKYYMTPTEYRNIIL